MREEELKFSVHGLFTFPELDAETGDLESAGHLRLTAVYYDTADLRLARAGITLRHRTGEDVPPWHLKLPSGMVNVREELTADGPPDTPPVDFTSLVTAWVRSAPLAPVATLQTEREVRRLRGADGDEHDAPDHAVDGGGRFGEISTDLVRVSVEQLARSRRATAELLNEPFEDAPGGLRRTRAGGRRQ